MKTLKVAVDNFDQVNTFQVASIKYSRVSLHCGMNKQDDGIYWGMLHSSVIKDVYTETDRAEQTRLASEAPLENGEVVIIEGEQYKVRVLGRFIDCCVFDKI